MIRNILLIAIIPSFLMSLALNIYMQDYYVKRVNEAYLLGMDAYFASLSETIELETPMRGM